jgi:hypothetical protein
MPQTDQNHPNLLPHWLVCAAMLLLLIAYNLVCHLYPAQIRAEIDESQRLVLRNVLYALAIIAFPLTNLMRHILLRLNQTMPGKKTAAQRYLLTVAITQSMIASISVFGPIMFVVGDDYNTLYIYSVLGLLGIFLYRPKADEHDAIAQALAAKHD